jgi:hypothetical protein
VKQGVKLNLDNLYDVLKIKSEKEKKTKQRQQELSSSVSSIQTTSTNIDDNNNSTVPNPPGAITTSSSSAITLLTSSAKNANASSSKYKSVHDHVVFIKDLIEKFSRKTFTSTILKDGEHYHLSITNTEQTFKAIIKCKCGTKIFLPSRSDTSTFILSNFYAHLTASTCSSVKEIVEEEKAEAEIQSILTPSVQASTTNSNNENSISSNRSKRKYIYESLPTTNSSSTKKRKR